MFLLTHSLFPSGIAFRTVQNALNRLFHHNGLDSKTKRECLTMH
nr:MAG TPA: hypothetical protein [Caudoviricetes sp.]